MPIDYADYPEDWRQMAKAVKDAAGWKCEQCGMGHMDEDNEVDD